MTAPEKILLVNPNTGGTTRQPPLTFLSVWQPIGWQLANPDDSQWVAGPVPPDPEDVITRPELVDALAGLSATFASQIADPTTTIGAAVDDAAFINALIFGG